MSKAILYVSVVLHIIGIFYPKEGDGHCVSIISGNAEKKSFGTLGSGPGQFNSPEGVAIDNGGNILHSQWRVQLSLLH